LKLYVLPSAAAAAAYLQALIGLTTHHEQHAQTTAALIDTILRMAQRVACVLLLVLAVAATAHASRSLQQQRSKTPAKQTVTPAACRSKIPSCETGKCIAQGVNVVCTQCRASYIRANNGLHCGELHGTTML
jgi:hypothetical protein